MYGILFSAVILQLTIAPYFAIGGVKPDIVIMFVILFGLSFGPSAGIEAGILGGFLQDVFALDFFWMNTFLASAAGFIAGAVSSQFSKDSSLTCALLVAMLTAISMTLHYLISALVSPYHALGFFEYLTGAIIPGSVITGAVSVIILLYFPELISMKNGADLL